jgi:hypothetical protein
LPNIQNGFHVAIPAHGCPSGTDLSSLTSFGLTESHQSTSPISVFGRGHHELLAAHRLNQDE